MQPRLPKSYSWLPRQSKNTGDAEPLAHRSSVPMRLPPQTPNVNSRNSSEQYSDPPLHTVKHVLLLSNDDSAEAVIEQGDVLEEYEDKDGVSYFTIANQRVVERYYNDDIAKEYIQKYEVEMAKIAKPLNARRRKIVIVTVITDYRLEDKAPPTTNSKLRSRASYNSAVSAASIRQHRIDSPLFTSHIYTPPQYVLILEPADTPNAPVNLFS